MTLTFPCKSPTHMHDFTGDASFLFTLLKCSKFSQDHQGNHGLGTIHEIPVAPPWVHNDHL